jgi:rhodanese-related sulfurtransferase
MPCGQDCDKKVYNEPGHCPGCGMVLVTRSSISFGSIEPDDLCDYIAKNPNIVLLDVRSPREFEGKSHPDYGTLKNAINIPIQELDSRMDELDKYKDKEIIVYCSHSQRSSQASYLLVQNGFRKVTNMAKGLRAMKDRECFEVGD